MIDPSAFVAHGAVLVGEVHLGRQSSVWYNSVVRGDMEPVRIGDQTNVQDLCVLHVDEGIPCTVGARVSIGHRAIVHGCTIEDDCLIGMGAVLLNQVRIGRGSVVGAGALVTEATVVPPGSLVLGVPARVVRAVDAALQRGIEFAWRHYIEEAARHRSGRFPLQGPGSP